MNRDKNRRIQQYAAQRKADRLKSGTQEYQEHLRAVAVADRMYWPTVKQIGAIKPFADYINHDTADGEQSLDSYMERRKRLNVAVDETVNIVEATLKAHRWTLANKILALSGEDALDAHADPMPILSCASSVFKIPSGHPTARIGYEVLAEETKEWRSPVLDNFCDEHPAVRSRVGAEAAKQMMSLAGLPQDASINDMDKKDMPFLCAKCGPTIHKFQTDSRDPWERYDDKKRKGELVLSWRQAVSPPSFCSQLQH